MEDFSASHVWLPKETLIMMNCKQLQHKFKIVKWLSASWCDERFPMIWHNHSFSSAFRDRSGRQNAGANYWNSEMAAGVLAGAWTAGGVESVSFKCLWILWVWRKSTKLEHIWASLFFSPCFQVFVFGFWFLVLKHSSQVLGQFWSEHFRTEDVPVHIVPLHSWSPTSSPNDQLHQVIPYIATFFPTAVSNV